MSRPTLQRKCASCESGHDEKVQAKLRVSQPDDVLEREADSVASTVMRMPSPTAPSLPADGVPVAHAASRHLPSSGRPLDATARRFLEPRMGFDFSAVRVHTDADAARSAQLLQASAFTIGRDIYFDQDQYQPETAGGRRLLAHELAHVVQQSAAGAMPHIARQQAQPRCPAFSEPHTVQARETATAIARARHTSLRCLQHVNPGLNLSALRAGHLINVPSTTCSVTVPSSSDEQILAGAIFAEADARRTDNDEREAIASTFVNRLAHVRELCDATSPACTFRTAAARATQCAREQTNFGTDMLSTVRIGSTAFGGGRWNSVMNGAAMRTHRVLCANLAPGEIGPLIRAIDTAHTMIGIRGRRGFVAFNQGSTPPSSRMQAAATIGAHTFYSFIPSRECG